MKIPLLLRSAIFSTLLITCFIFSSCGCHFATIKEYQVDKINIYGKLFNNTDEVIWQDGLMVFDIVWVLEKMNVELEWDNNIAYFSLNETDYILDLDKQILREKGKEQENSLVYGAGRNFIGKINGKLYVDSATLTFVLYDLKLYSYVEDDHKNNTVNIVINPNYPR